MTAAHSTAITQPVFFALGWRADATSSSSFPSAAGAAACAGTSSVGASSVGSIKEKSEDIDAVQRPYAHEHAPHDVLLLYEVFGEIPRVTRILAVVTQHVIRVWRH